MVPLGKVLVLHGLCPYREEQAILVINIYKTLYHCNCPNISCQQFKTQFSIALVCEMERLCPHLYGCALETLPLHHKLLSRDSGKEDKSEKKKNLAAFPKKKN